MGKFNEIRIFNQKDLANNIIGLKQIKNDDHYRYIFYLVVFIVRALKCWFKFLFAYDF